MNIFIDVPVETIAYDLVKMMSECQNRGLRQSCIWAAELYHALNKFGLNFVVDHSKIKPYFLAASEVAGYNLAKHYFDFQEYDRAAHFTEKCVSSAPRFLHYYSIFCTGEKQKLDKVCDSSFHPRGKSRVLQSLCHRLRKMRLEYKMDGYLMYLYGVVLKKLQLDKQAVPVLIEAINLEPLNWGSWLELSTLINDFPTLIDLPVPNHWIKNFFLAQTYLELQLNDLALDIYNRLSTHGFAHSTYILAQKAIAFHNMRSLERAIDGFRAVLKVDPYRLENLDIYSNLLYVKEMRSEMCKLAEDSCQIDKYRAETCCVIGNFYSLRTEHKKAVLYFQRASQINPNYLSAWTLMGHEYMEMKNTSYAIQAYRRAIEINRRDYRAWYGLGQTYEILKMPFYCLYYYKQAQLLRPHDSRMIVALGESYEKLENFKEARKCYWKAHAVGDVDGMALMKLAKLYEKINEHDQAAAAYTDYCRRFKANDYNDRESAAIAYLYLANYYYKKSDPDKAYASAHKCLEYSEANEQAEIILRQIVILRATLSDDPVEL